MNQPFSADELAFLNAIHAAPRDDTPRLVYADWLEDGKSPPDPELAEMIRLGVEAGRTGTPFQLVPRMKELDVQLRRRYVSPVPDRLTFSNWERGLPLIGAAVDIRDANYRQILGSIAPRHALYSFSLGLRHSTTSGLRAMLSHPVMGQVHRLWLKLTRRTTVEDIRLVAETPRIRRIEFSIVEYPMLPEIGDAIMFFLAPLIPIGWWEVGHQFRIDSRNPATWPARFGH